MAIIEYKSDKEFSKNCIKIATAIKRKYNLKFPSLFKNLYCKKCYNILLPDLGAKIRIIGKGRNLKIITTCLDCKRVIRKEITRR